MNFVIMALAGSIALSSSAFGSDWTFLSVYELSGECGNFKISSAPGAVTFSSEALIPGAWVGQGPTNDGANGCGNFEALFKCPSKNGYFTVTSIAGPIFTVGPVVLKFMCKK